MTPLLRPFEPSTPGEREFLAKSWVESYASSATAKLVTHQGLESRDARRWKPAPEYWDTWDGLANALLRHARVLVAEDPEHRLIAGFLCWELDEEGTVVHYVYTRFSGGYRRTGIARALVETLPSGPVRYTHRAPTVRVPDGWRFTLKPRLRYLDGARRAA